MAKDKEEERASKGRIQWDRFMHCWKCTMEGFRPTFTGTGAICNFLKKRNYSFLQAWNVNYCHPWAGPKEGHAVTIAFKQSINGRITGRCSLQGHPPAPLGCVSWRVAVPSGNRSVFCFHWGILKIKSCQNNTAIKAIEILVLAQLRTCESHLIRLANFPSWNNTYYYLYVCADRNASTLSSFVVWSIIYTDSMHRGRLLWKGSVSTYRCVRTDVHASAEEAPAAAVESEGMWRFRLCLRAGAQLQCRPQGTHVPSRSQQQGGTDLRILQPSPRSPKGAEVVLSALKCSRGETC